MFDVRIKFLASLYTTVLMGILVLLLLFGGFKLKPKPIKGTVINATMIDVSQLKSLKNNKQKPKKQIPTEKIKPKKAPTKSVDKPDIKKAEPKKIIKPKKQPPRIVKKEPKIDTKKLERERKEQEKLIKQRKALEKRKQAAKQRRKQAEEDLKNLLNNTDEEKKEPTKQVLGTASGQTKIDERTKLLTLYQAAIISAVERQWNKPTSANKDLVCHVKVTQIIGGIVMNATIGSPCNANSIVKKSILAAIKKADPLPYKGFEDVFDRNANFIFQPKN